jgi:hypothetical protein
MLTANIKDLRYILVYIIINSIMGNGLLADVVGQIIQLDFSGELGVIE